MVPPLARGKRHGGRSKTGIRASRTAKTAVKSTKRRSVSSRQWLTRQINDPYVAEARTAGYRSRAAYKLIQLDDKYRLLKAGARVIDLGAAPGGWTQVAVARAGPAGRVVALDLAKFHQVPGAICLTGDVRAHEMHAQLQNELGGPADLVLSDMAAPTVGHAKTDHLRVMALAEAAHDCARSLLAEKGALVVKLLQGGAELELLTALKSEFQHARHVKPPASRSDSREIYLVATGFRGREKSASDDNE